MFLLFLLFSSAFAGCQFNEDLAQPFTSLPEAVACLRSLGSTGAELESLKQQVYRAGAYWSQLYVLGPWLNDSRVTAEQVLDPHDMVSANNLVLEANTTCDVWNRASWVWSGAHDAHSGLSISSECNAFQFKFPLAFTAEVVDGVVRYRIDGWSKGSFSSVAGYNEVYGVDLTPYLNSVVTMINGEPIYTFLAREADQLGIGGRSPASRFQSFVRMALDSLIEVSPKRFQEFATTNAPLTLGFANGSTLSVHYLAVSTSNRLDTLSTRSSVLSSVLPPVEEGERLPVIARSVREESPIEPLTEKRTPARAGLSASTQPSDLLSLVHVTGASKDIYVLRVLTFSQGTLSQDVAALKSGLAQHLRTLASANCLSPVNEVSNCILFIDLTANGGGYVHLARLFVDILFAEEQQPNQLPMSFRADSSGGAALFKAFYRTKDLHEPDTQSPVTEEFWTTTRTINVAGASYRYGSIATERTGVTTVMRGAYDGSVSEFNSLNGDFLTADEIAYYNDIKAVRSSAGYRWPTDGRNYGGKTLHSEQVFFLTSPHRSASAAAFVAAFAAAHNFGTTIQLGGDFTGTGALTPIQRGNLLSGLVPGGNVVSSDDARSYVDSPVMYPSASVTFSCLSNVAARPDLREKTDSVPLCYTSSEQYFSPHVSIPSSFQYISSEDALIDIVSMSLIYAIQKNSCASGFASAFADTENTCTSEFDGTGGLWCESASFTSQCGPAYCPLGTYVTQNQCVSHNLVERTPLKESSLPKPLPSSRTPSGVSGMKGIVACLSLLAIASIFL